jgi:hypothetical protein
MSDNDFDDDSYYDEMCECELDWCCGLHRHLATPEDRLATAWAEATGRREDDLLPF